jgi:predicted pyridoxine 5'-phosphate oxidase superfamily flavin-nucleotide-binding protein
VLDHQTIAFAEFRGNRQFITHGNLAENPKAHLFLIDYSSRQRMKLWGTARVVEDDPALVEGLTPPGRKVIAERAIVFRVHAWDANCPRHIPHLVDAETAAAEIEARDRRIAELEAQLARFTGARSSPLLRSCWWKRSRLSRRIPPKPRHGRFAWRRTRGTRAIPIE